MPTPRHEFLEATHGLRSSNQTFDPTDKRESVAVLTPPPLSRSKKVLPPLLPNSRFRGNNTKKTSKVLRQSLSRKKTVIIVSVVIGFVILCLSASLMIMTGKDGSNLFSPYQVEYKQYKDGCLPLLEVEIKGPAYKLAVMLTNPEGETEIEIIEKEEMIDNIEAVRVGWHSWEGKLRGFRELYYEPWRDRGKKGPEPLLTYTLLIKTFNPEKVVFRENLKFSAGGWLRHHRSVFAQPSTTPARAEYGATEPPLPARKWQPQPQPPRPESHGGGGFGSGIQGGKGDSG